MPTRILSRRPFIEAKPLPESAILVCGSGRSGTTWVGDVVAAKTCARIKFEPFLLAPSGRFQLAAEGGTSLSSRLESPVYLSDQTPDDSFWFADIEKILFGEQRSRWADQEIKAGIYGRRLIKEIRANLIFGAIRKRWPDLKILYVLRSPFLVIRSMLTAERIGWSFAWRPEDVLRNVELVRSHLSHAVLTIQRAASSTDLLTIRWCIETLVAVSELRKTPQGLVVNYEDLLQPDGWTAVGKFLSDRGWKGLTPSEKVLSRPSPTSVTNSDVSGSEDLKSAQIRRVQELLETFGIDRLVPQSFENWMRGLAMTPPQCRA